MPKHARHMNNISEALSIKYNNRVYELKQKGARVIVLSLGEAFFDIPLRPFDDLPFPDIYHYSHSRGLVELREKLSLYYRNEYGVTIDPLNEILITTGSKAAIYMALASIIDPGDEIIIPEPAWVSYTEQVKLCHGIPRTIPFDKTVFEYEKYINEKTKAIIVNSPHNPRGNMLTTSELNYLHDLVKANDIYLLGDEAYSDFVNQPSQFVSCGVGDPQKSNTIIFNSMSKNYGMSGWRIGYVIANPETIYQILKINQHLITCPATILQQYLSRHFTDIIAITKPQIAEVVEKRNELGKYMESIGLNFLPGNATFYFFVSIKKSKLTSDDFCTRLLEESHICCVPGIGYGKSCDKFIRVSVGTETMETLKLGVNAIKLLIQKTS